MIKKIIFPTIIFLILIVNSLVFLPKYGSWNGATDIEHQEIAINMAGGKGFSLNGERTMFREPAYPFFLFANFKLFGVNRNLIRVEQFLILATIIYLTYKLAHKIFGSREAKISALLVAATPIFAIYATDLIAEIFSALLILVFILVFLKTVEKKGNKVFLFYASLSGAMLGILTLTKSIFIFLPVFFAPLLFFMAGKGKPFGEGNSRNNYVRKRTVAVLLFFAFFAGAIFPWMYRNYNHFGKLAIADRGGMLLYLHALKSEFNYEQLKDYTIAALSGEYFVRLYKPDYDIVKGEGIDLMNKKREGLIKSGYHTTEADEIMGKEAKSLFARHPFKNFYIGVLEIIKLNAPMVPKYSVIFIHPNINAGILAKVVTSTAILGIRIIGFVFIALVGYGIFRAAKEKNKKALALVAFIFYLNGIIFFLQGVPRFVFPIYPLYFTFFAFSITYLARKYFLNSRTFTRRNT